VNFVPKERPDSSVFHMTAMVDVVFILLSFFILASEFRRDERDVTMGHAEPQVLAAGAAAEDFPSRIQIRLRRAEEDVAISVGQARLDPNDYAAIREKLTEINMPAIDVQIQADPNLSVDQVARAVDAVLASPMKKLSIAKLTFARPGG